MGWHDPTKSVMGNSAPTPLLGANGILIISSCMFSVWGVDDVDVTGYHSVLVASECVALMGVPALRKTCIDIPERVTGSRRTIRLRTTSVGVLNAVHKAMRTPGKVVPFC